MYSRLRACTCGLMPAMNRCRVLLGGGFGGERIAGVEEAQYVLVLVVAVCPQQGEQAVPALP